MNKKSCVICKSRDLVSYWSSNIKKYFKNALARERPQDEIKNKASKLLALNYLIHGDEEADDRTFSHIHLLNKVFSELEQRGVEIDADLLEAEKRVRHLEGATTLTEDEHLEYESATSWLYDAVDEYQSHRTVLSDSLLIAMSKMVETRANAAADILTAHSERKYDKWKLSRIGPKVGKSFWAESVLVGGNYVRHREEWKVFPYKRITLPDGSKGLQKFAGNLVNLLTSGMQRSNANVLIGMGLDQEELLVQQHEISHKIIKALKLNDNAEVAALFFQWKNDMMAEVRNQMT